MIPRSNPNPPSRSSLVASSGDPAMLLRHHPIHHLVQVNPHPQPTAALMASSPPPALVATFLLLLAGAASAQSDESVPPPSEQQLPPTNASDVAALREVFQRWGLEDDATADQEEDPCWKRVWFESFGTNESVGCSCSGDECRVTHLNVTGYRNITEISLALFNSTELVSLDLSNNNLSGLIPQEIVSLSKLETWHFNNNHLNGSFPPGSSLLINLQSLWMFDNYIDGPVPEFIQNLTNLKDLRIYGMKLQGPIPINFSKLNNLEHLMLGDLDGNHSSFNFIENWATLSTLSLRKCGLTGQLPSDPPRLPKLHYLKQGGPWRPTNITHEVILDNSILVTHLYWSGRGTCCIPYRGAYGPLVSAIKVFPSEDSNTTPPRAPRPQAPHSARQDDKRRGMVAGIAALCIAGAVIFSSMVYLWWKWVSLVKHPMA